MNAPQSSELDRLKRLYGSNITADELRSLQSIRSNLDAAIQDAGSFPKLMVASVDELRRLTIDLPEERRNFDSIDFREKLSQQSVSVEDFSGFQSQEISLFCRDAVNAIDYAVRNGINIMFICNVLSHDFTEWLDTNPNEGIRFRSKVSGWAELNRATVGDPAEEESGE